MDTEVERVDTSTLAKALAAFQAQLPKVIKSELAKVKTKTGPDYSYRYADLAQISAVVLPRLGAVGLSFTAKPTLIDGRFVLAYRLLHSSGDEDAGIYPLPSTGTAQEQGSAITYARRYSLCSMVGVAPDEDDDGAAATRMHDRPPGWDPVEQDVLHTAWSAEIEDAKDQAELTEIGRKVSVARTSGELSPNTHAKLGILAARRRAELNSLPQPADPTGQKPAVQEESRTS